VRGGFAADVRDECKELRGEIVDKIRAEISVGRGVIS
jgi:hypothetical protein